MSPVNGFPARSIQAPRTSLGLALYPDGIFFDHNPFYNATRLRVVNTMIADVLEGQLLTAIIVVSFIIVFLIKEWVVQQQPAMAGDAADMPLLNEQEPFVAPPADPAPAALHDPGVLDPAEALAGPANEEDYENWMGRAFEGQDNPPVDTDGAQATPENAQVDGAAEAPEQRVFAQPRPRRRHGGAEMIENNSNPEVDNDAIQEGEGVSTGFNFAEMQRPTPTRESTAQVLTLRRDLEETNRVGGANTPYDFGGTKSSTDNLFQFGGANPEPTRPQTMWERDSPAVPAEATNNMDTIDTGRTAAWMRDNVASGSGVPVVAERRMSDITGLNDDTTDKSGSASWASTSSFEFVSGPVDKGKSPERPLSTEIIEHSHVEEILAEGNTESTENDEGEAGPSEDITTEIKGKESVESGEAQVDAYSEDITVESKGKEIFESGDAQYSEDEGESRAEGSVGFGTSEWSTIAQAGDTPVPSDVSATPPPMVDPLDYYERRRGTDLPDNARIELERLNNERRIDEIRNRIRLRNQPAHDHVQNQDWANRAPHGPAPPRHDEAENREQPLQIEAPAVQAEDNVRRGGLLDWIIGEDEPDVANRQGIDAEDTDDEDNQLAAGALPQPILDDDAADDFEGIMELVGMRGPLLGLVQNAAISSMLITATVAVGVAFPYVVGKTVMMILAHPILFFFRLPGLAISFCAEFLVDTATMIGFSLLLFLDQVAKFFLEPLSFIAPSLSSDAITNFLKNWATDGQNRVFAKFTSIETTYLAIRKYPPSAVPPLSLVIREALMRLLQSTKWGLGKLGIFRLVPATISAGPAAFDLKVVNVTNPVAWAVHTWDGTLAAVNFTKPSNISAADAIAQFEHHLSHPYDGVYKWSALDRIGVVLLGYAFFTMVGMIYVRKRRSEQASNIERLLVEFLQQCGGVMKVVLIIGIEMFVFPLYCGVLLGKLFDMFFTFDILTKPQTSPCCHFLRPLRLSPGSSLPSTSHSPTSLCTGS